MSDDFDEFDDDLTGLDFAELDQKVQTLLPPASQQPRNPPPPPQPIKQKYHHTVAHPSKQPVPRTSLSKDPGPINTEPRAAGAGSGFGWNVDGGKRSYDGNLDRHLGDEQRRNDKWRERQNKVEEEEFPEVVLRKEGGYGFGITETEGQNVTKGLAPSASQNTSGAAARRAAIINASRSTSVDLGNNAVAGPSRLPQPQQQQSIKQPRATSRPPDIPHNQFAPRTLARSTSAGHQPQPLRPLSRNGISNLPTILSQSQTPTNSQQPPASQGTLARKTAIELAEEVRKREIAEEEIKVLRAEVERVRLESLKPVENVKTADIGRDGDNTKDYAKLQQELWAAQGEGKNIRRAQKDLEAKHANEAEKWRLKVEEMEARLQARDKESARQVENIKSQAVFSNHAAHNSVLKMRQPNASQRPAATPHRGSPQGKSKPESLLQTITGKGKSKSIDRSIPAQPNFGNLTNAFAKSPTITTRVKRAKTELREREEVGSPPHNAFVKPKGKGKERDYGREETRSPFADRDGDEGMNGMDEGGGVGDGMLDEVDDGPVEAMEDVAPGVVPEDETGWGNNERDMRTELLYTLTTHLPLSPLQATLYPDGITQPTLYRLLNYQPADDKTAYAQHCSKLLKACGEDLTYDSTLTVIGSSCVGFIQIILGALATNDLNIQAIIAVNNILDLLARLVWLFPDLANHLQGLTAQLSRIVDSFFDTGQMKIVCEGFAKQAGDLYAYAWRSELAQCVAKVAEGLCWFAKGGSAWSGQDLAAVTHGLLETSLPVEIVRCGVDLVWAAACNKNNFRALISNIGVVNKEQPLLTRIGHLLIKAHAEATEKEAYEMTLTLIRAVGLLTIADRDAVILVAEQSIIVPALILVIHRESTRIWGIWADGCDIKSSLQIIQPALSLLHHLIYPLPLPPPSLYQINPIVTPTSKRQPAYTNPLMDPEPLPQHLSTASQVNVVTSPQGINLPQVLQRLGQEGSGRVWNGLGNIFVSCLGSLAYGAVEDELGRMDLGGEEWDLEIIQYLSQDILESVVEGPEGDAVYEIYAEDEEGNGGSVAMMSGRRDSGDRDGVDESVLKDMGVEGDDETRDGMAVD